jgi:hypothetical protein
MEQICQQRLHLQLATEVDGVAVEELVDVVNDDVVVVAVAVVFVAAAVSAVVVVVQVAVVVVVVVVVLAHGVVGRVVGDAVAPLEGAVDA